MLFLRKKSYIYIEGEKYFLKGENFIYVQFTSTSYIKVNKNSGK